MGSIVNVNLTFDVLKRISLISPTNETMMLEIFTTLSTIIKVSMAIVVVFFGVEEKNH